MANTSLWKALWNPRMLICIFIGFSSGLPYYFLIQLVPGWLRDQKLDLITIGWVSFFVGAPFTYKFFWAPICDRYAPLLLGRRRGWMLITQIGLLISMAALGFLDPVNMKTILIVGAFITAMFSATQDIVIDAFRRDILPDEELGLGNSFHVNAWRVAGFIPGGLAFILADHMAWQWVFLTVALFMIPGILCTLAVSEPKAYGVPPKNISQAIVQPFLEFFRRSDTSSAVLILFFVMFYKFGDSLATSLATPFYLDLGFTKTQIGVVSKSVGVTTMLVGGFIGGLVMVKLGINKCLWIFGFIQMISILGFAILAEVGNNINALAMAHGFEYLGVGLGSAALLAYIASQTDKRFSATQLALFSSLFAIPRSLGGVITGALVEGTPFTAGIGWTWFFVVCFFTAIPGMVLLFWVAPWNEKSS